ncbi:MAG: hypothetical protein KAT43_00075 [Nanoarchaeota archaeon]|nr:hypothetical protein [Nanoarchaeota archaeon]
MKHTFNVTIVLLILFLVSQMVGLVVVDQYIDKEKSAIEGETVWKDLPYQQERPPVEKGTSYIFILVAVLVGTGIALLLIKFGFWWLWKLWFFFAVWLCVAFAFSAFMDQYIALILALFLAGFKLFKPNAIVHNLAEIFIYAGIAAILVPIMNLWAAVIMLIIISVYDYWAVFKSKHMVTLAKEQAKHRVFAGLLLPYAGKIKKFSLADLKKKKIKVPKKILTKAKAEAKKKGKKIKLKMKTYQTAILGGGDMAFALIFTGVAMKSVGFTHALIIPIFTTAALAYILFKGRKDKFYPAMPFISAGCLIGYLAAYCAILL